jgi:hypothetical protein
LCGKTGGKRCCLLIRCVGEMEKEVFAMLGEELRKPLFVRLYSSNIIANIQVIRNVIGLRH